MQILLFGLCLISCLRLQAAADQPAVAWSSDFTAAAEVSAKTGRPMLLNFTGSDWCVWCHRLRDEVFQAPFFQKYAADGLVLVEIDFPKKTPLPPDLKSRNEALAKKYGVDTYPTIILLGADGKELARLGYMQGGPKTFVRELKRRIAAVDTPK